MHNKLVIADDVVVTGSFNLSNHAMGNAESVLLIRDDADIASKYETYIRQPMKTEIFNIASEPLASHTSALSKKVILIALLEPAQKSGTPQSETDAGFANQNSLPVHPWSMTFSSISPIRQRADFRPRSCRSCDP